MLPKHRGQRRTAAEFSEPTGKIYTSDQLVQKLTPLCPKNGEKSRPEEKAAPK
jgi:hypothetical protein